MGGETNFFNVFDIFMLSPAVLKLECLQSDALAQYALQAFFLPVVALAILAIVLASKWCPGRRVDVAKAVNTLLSVMQGVLITLTNISLSAFQCFEHPNGKSSLYQFPQILCWQDDHPFFIVLSIWMILSVIVTFNVIFLWAVWVVYARRYDFEASIVLLTRFKLFFQRWRSDRWYWGYMFTLRQMLFACTVLFYTTAFDQIKFAVSILTVYNLCLALLLPWRLFEINVFEFIISTLFVFLLLNAIGIIPPPVNEIKYVNTVCVFLVLLVCSGVVYIGRVCLGFLVVGTPKRKFPIWPKPADDQKLIKNLEMFRTMTLDQTTLEQIVKNIPDTEKHKFVYFFYALQVACCNSCPFDFDCGFRMYVPNENHIHKEHRCEMIDKIKNSESKHESYI